MSYIEIIGFAAAFSTTIAMLPQAIKTIQTRHTKDLSLIMYSVLTFGILLWLIYGILIQDGPLMAANTVSFILAAIILGMKIRYK
tara:strand:+ start:422 stop:676 length:255 start_codon:yes stop_codon:yes gene_type:complete